MTMPTVKHVRVYGNDHSPWVQAVLLGLHEHGIPYTLSLLPPLSVFLDSGVLMPAAQVDDEPWRLDSERILVRLGCGEVSEGDRDRLRRVFRGALDRTVPPGRFWIRFSWVRDGALSTPRRVWNQFGRAFSIFYFFSLITFARLGLKTPCVEGVCAALDEFDDQLSGGGSFLSGGAPDTVDFQLFGLVQMFASIPGDSYEALRDPSARPHLRAWISRMHDRFDFYPHLYSGPDFEPRCEAPQRTGALERAAFWIGAATMWLALPVSLLATLFFVVWVRVRGRVD